MVKNLIEKGRLENPLIIWNRTTSKAEDLSKQLGNSTVASTPEEAVEKADIIFTCVGGDQDMIDLINKAISVNVKGKLFVDCSTIHPGMTPFVSLYLI
jgi:3-hydroxyisobutyrate dehydrogenase-like beta-hydroxyacid dehydrogenase